MTLQIQPDGDPADPPGSGMVEAVVSCDVELTDDCSTFEELGEHQGWSDQQFHDLITGPEYRWTFDPSSRRYLCPACAVADRRRRRPAALAREGFGAPFGSPTAPSPPTDAGGW